ncbi:4-hydroxy-3-methylbut-2-enyl diphosphate reductase [Parelusimicrobium proximum]|uniref:4-hydroxy-3-methylbut-2-enyl diphosphate reductase n=1 Tax=Parelusimicrobium proximum TaxID=3228953 RepID=UPI003D16B1FC
MKRSESDIVVAKSAGFCPGVKKAIDIVLELEASGKKPIYTIGPLIHNKQVIESLEAKDIISIDSPSEIEPKSAVLVIRAHGVTPEFQREIEGAARELCDATCPLVKHVHNVISAYDEKGYTTVIVGDAGHAEVIGLLGYAKEKSYVVANEEEAGALPEFEKVNVVAQTTQQEETFNKIAAIIKAKSKEAVVSNTICHPTKQRQSETVEEAKNADMVIVVGGKHSANTTRLAKLCGELCPNTILVENEKELNKNDILSAKKIFITAGASTPNWVIDNVYTFVKNTRSAGRSFGYVIKNIWSFIVENAIYTAFSATALTYVAMQLQRLRYDLRILFLSWFFVFSLTYMNRVVGKSKNLSDRKIEITIAFLSGAAGLTAAMMISFQVFLVTALFWVLGVMYPFRSHLELKKFTAMPATKDIVTALGWAFVCSYVPAYTNGVLFTKAYYLSGFYVLLLVFVRSVVLSIGAAHKDIMIGRESFYKAFGIKVTSAAISGLIIALSCVLIMLLMMGWNIRLVSMLLAGNIYIIFAAVYCCTKNKPRSVMEETIVDGQFFVLAILSYMSRFI